MIPGSKRSIPFSASIHFSTDLEINNSSDLCFPHSSHPQFLQICLNNRFGNGAASPINFLMLRRRYTKVLKSFAVVSV
jgi:hypothetical protein